MDMSEERENYILVDKLNIDSIWLEVIDDLKKELYKKYESSIDDAYWKLKDCEKKTDYGNYEITSNMYNIFLKISFVWKIKEQSCSFINYLLCNKHEFEELYNLLKDCRSKETLIWLIKANIAYSIAGDVYRIYKLPQDVIKVTKDMLIPNYLGTYFVGKYEIYSNEQVMYDTWVRNQYMLRGICEPQIGDVVVSVGAYYGETSIWFSDRVGDEGKVYAFEASDINYNIAKNNLMKNNIKNVILENICLWKDKSLVNFEQNYGSSMISTCKKNSIQLYTDTIDNYCHDNEISQIDYLKMDIEGAELSVLLGAADTIKNSHPALAICCYHSPSDYVKIPFYIKELVPNYDIYISHKRDDFYETVIFAIVNKL